MTKPPTKAKRRTRVPLTDAAVTRLRRLREQTGVGPNMLMRGTRGEAPRGLNSSVIRSWLLEKTRSAFPDHLSYVENRWQAILDNNQQRVSISPDDWQHLTSVRKAAGITLRRTVADPACPRDLSLHVLQNYCATQPSSIRNDHLVYLQRIWQLPKPGDPPLPPSHKEVTNTIHETLSRYQSLGYLPGPIFDSPASPPPAGLRPQTISSWISRRTRSAQPAHLDWVFRECAAMLTNPRRPIHITETMHTEFMLLREFTKLGPLAIFEQLHPVPSGLTAAKISSWSQRTARIALHHHWVSVMALLRDRAERRSIAASRRQNNDDTGTVYDPSPRV